ncbi:MAG: hypothetical protein KDA61_19185 [Planctomycetales bacterium]|nr:hypothetical protein [Planctomycetales bacterium]
MSRTTRLILAIAAAFAVPASISLALGFRLGESKEELKLEYEVSVYDHATGRITVEFTLIDTGRLKPINSVDLHISSGEKHDGGGFKSDLAMSMALRKEGTKQIGRVHLRKDWAERAEIQIKTGQLDGKPEPLTWYYYAVPLKDLVARAKPHETTH